MKLYKRIDDESSNEFNKYLGMLKKFVIDNNAVAQDKGLEAVLAFLEAASPSISGRLVSNISALCTRVSPTISALAKNLTIRGRWSIRFALQFNFRNPVYVVFLK